MKKTISELELVTSVDLNYVSTGSGAEVYQFIYASQLYGTLFGVYGRFGGRETTNASGKIVFEVDRIFLQLENYKGDVNIGLPDALLNWGTSDGVNFIEFHVAGANKDSFRPYTITPFEVEKGGKFTVDFKRILDPMPDFFKYFQHRIGPDGINQSRYQLSGEPPATQVFDTEFNDRDGIDFFNRELRLGMLGFEEHRLAGHRCNTSRVIFSY